MTPSAPPNLLPFGPRVRRLRKEAGLTLKMLAARAGLAISTISKIENDRMSPTYDVLLKLAAGLNTDLVALMDDPKTEVPEPVFTQRPVRLDVTRRAERRSYPAGPYIYEPFAMGLTNRAMNPTVVTIVARSVDAFPELIVHPGEELVYVLLGSIELHSEFYAPIRLDAGDSVYFDGEMGHAYISVSEEDAVILNICSGVNAGKQKLAGLLEPAAGM
jgi:transcriptional regulator with XRE-family HTH domain